jgi:hypothetical protein
MSALKLISCTVLMLLLASAPALAKKGKHPHTSGGVKSAHLGIPPGHLPPPGHCRIWYPGRPPGWQPPPGPCSDVRRRLPAGAWLVYRDSPEHVRVSVISRARPGIVVGVRLYEAQTGLFIRLESH